MNEIQLSDSLPVIETEIRQYQNLAGESIFEIGRRLKHVKENDLAHGEYGAWLKSVNLNDSQARKFIKVFDENLNRSTSNTLGLEALYQISTLPEPERTKEHVTEKGETKTPDEMTVRELRELKKQLKQRDELVQKTQSQLQQAQQAEELLQTKLENAENIEPEVIERYTDPEDYQDTKNMNDHLSKEREYYKNLADDFRKEVKELTSSKNINESQELGSVDQTSIILSFITQIGKMLDSDLMTFDKFEVKNVLSNLLKKVDE